MEIRVRFVITHLLIADGNQIFNHTNYRTAVRSLDFESIW